MQGVNRTRRQREESAVDAGCQAAETWLSNKKSNLCGKESSQEWTANRGMSVFILKFLYLIDQITYTYHVWRLLYYFTIIN